MSIRSRTATIALTTITAAAAGYGYELGRKAGAADWLKNATAWSPKVFGNGIGISGADLLERLYKGKIDEDQPVPGGGTAGGTGAGAGGNGR